MSIFSNFIRIFAIILFVSSCTFSSGTGEKSYGLTKFITGSAAIDTVKDVHVINLIRAIGTPNNSMTVGKYKYYQWQHSRTVGVSTLFGGGSTTLYCSLTAETQTNKIKSINWYGNQCGIFLDSMGEYFKDKLNIAVIVDEDEKKQSSATIKNTAGENDLKEKTPEHNKPAIDLRQKSLEQKTSEQPNITEPKTNPIEHPSELKQTVSEKGNIIETR